MIGTFEYMAPEQMVGGTTTGQSDIYTLGVVMYEMITGERPYGDPETPAAMLAAIISQRIAPVSARSDAPEDLDPIIARCLDREIAKRYATVEELAVELEAVLAHVEDVTNTRVTRAPSVGDDTKTWIEQAPESAHPYSTLPGVAPPSRNTPWPIVDPRRKR
jgi:serine/threonine protein kinase